MCQNYIIKLKKMKKFSIAKNDNIKIDIRHKGFLILPSLYDEFKNIDEIKNFVKCKLPWNYKGYGKRIEIGIHNLTKEKSKYINIFS